MPIGGGTQRAAAEIQRLQFREVCQGGQIRDIGAGELQRLQFREVCQGRDIRDIGEVESIEIESLGTVKAL